MSEKQLSEETADIAADTIEYLGVLVNEGVVDREDALRVRLKIEEVLQFNTSLSTIALFDC